MSAKQNTPSLDWDDLHTVLAISRHGTLSAAARALQLTQSTVGRRLDNLQQRLGVILLQKTPSGYVTTEACTHILANLERMEQEALSVATSIGGQDTRLTGSVRVTTVEVLATHFIAPSLTGLRQHYPGLTVELDTDTRSLSLSRREADIAIRLVRFEQHDVMVRKIATMGFGLFVSPDYLARRGEPDFSNGCAGHDLVTVQEDQLHLPEARWLTDHASRAMIAIRSNSRAVLLRCAQAGLGLTCLPLYMADAGLIRLTPPIADPQRDIWIGVHKDIRRSPRIRVVVDHLVRALQASFPDHEKSPD